MSNADGPLKGLWPPMIYGGFALAALLLSHIVPLPFLPRPASDLAFGLGVITTLGGIWIIFAAERTMKKANTPVLPTRRAEHLVTQGPFGFTRNPIYLGMTLILFGIGLIFGLPWFFAAGLLAAFTAQKLAIEAEEKHLEHRFGKAYREYRKKVRRWV